MPAGGFQAKYIVRKRDYWSEPSDHGPKRRFGKWIKVSARKTQEEAAADLEKIQGQWDKAIYYRGERLDRNRAMEARGAEI